jgi:hypothetical protein
MSKIFDVPIPLAMLLLLLGLDVLTIAIAP